MPSCAASSKKPDARPGRPSRCANHRCRSAHGLEACRQNTKRAGTAQHLLSATRQMFRWAIKRQPWRSLAGRRESGRTGGAEADRSARLRAGDPGAHSFAPQKSGSCATSSNAPHPTTTAQQTGAARPGRSSVRRSLRYGSALEPAAGSVSSSVTLGARRLRQGDLVRSAREHQDARRLAGLPVRLHVAPSQGTALPDRRHGMVLSCTPARRDRCSPRAISKQVGDRQIRFKSAQELGHRRNDNSLVLADGANGAWTPHDLRRTAATMMQGLRVSPDVIDRCQNHVLPGSKVAALSPLRLCRGEARSLAAARRAHRVHSFGRQHHSASASGMRGWWRCPPYF